jgi:hypothetical protein
MEGGIGLSSSAAMRPRDRLEDDAARLDGITHEPGAVAFLADG